MSARKLYFVLVGALVLLGIGVFVATYEVDAMLQRKSHQLVSLQAKSEALSQQQAQLIKDKKDIAKYKPLNDIAKTIVPQDKDQAEAVREIVNLAAANGISRLSSVTFPTSTLGGSTATGATAPTKTPTAPKGNLTQLLPVPGIGGVYTLQITIQQNTDSLVPYSRFIGFLRSLEQNRRTAQVSSITVLPDAKNPNLVAFTLIIEEYIKP